jgi:hypothetical protein
LKLRIENKKENDKIYKEVINERRRFIKHSYVIKETDNLETILETLNDHFIVIK